MRELKIPLSDEDNVSVDSLPVRYLPLNTEATKRVLHVSASSYSITTYAMTQNCNNSGADGSHSESGVSMDA